jgi:hypothetical protein
MHSTLHFFSFFAEIGDRAIIIDTQRLNQSTQQQLEQQGITTRYDGARIAFSEEDLETVKALDGVENAVLFREGITIHADRENNIFRERFYSSEFNQLLSRHTLGRETTVEFDFSALHVPAEFLPDLNPNQINLLAGHFLADNSDELLIPDIFAMMIFDTEDFSQIIGKAIDLNVISLDDVDDWIPLDMIGDEYQQSKIYTISGIYTTYFRQHIEQWYAIYTGFFEAPKIELKELEENYLVMQTLLSSHEQAQNFNYRMIENFDSFIQARGTGDHSMLIRVNDPRNIISVSERLSELFPAYDLLSQYDVRNGEFSFIYRALVTGLVISFLNKGCIYGRSRELAILYSLGYQKKDILKIILVENLILFSLNFIIALLLAYLANLIYFSRSSHHLLFSNIFEFTTIFMIFSLIMLMAIISVIWGLSSVKASNLRKFLN